MENFTEIRTKRKAAPCFWKGPRDIKISINSFEKVEF